MAFKLLPERVMLLRCFRSTQIRAPAIQRNFFTSISTRQTKQCLSSPSPSRPSSWHFARFQSPVIRRLKFRRHNSTKPNPDPTSNLGSPQPSLSITQRFRKLSREYGYSAVGVYLFLSALDFPFCFLAVRALGTDRIAHWEHVVMDWFWKVVPWPFPEKSGVNGAAGDAAPEGWGVEDAEKRNRAPEASIWTQLALAYAIHKSFIFVRVPLTAAITPKVVKVLRARGWDIGKRTPKPKK